MFVFKASAFVPEMGFLHVSDTKELSQPVEAKATLEAAPRAVWSSEARSKVTEALPKRCFQLMSACSEEVFGSRVRAENL